MQEDIQLHLIEEANLISARRHGIDLDLPGVWARSLKSEAAASWLPAEQARHELADRVSLLRNRLRAVIVHAWPLPQDAVVVALRQEASGMMAELDRLSKYLSA